MACGDYHVSGSRILLNGRLHFTHAAGTLRWSAPVEFLLPGAVSSEDSGTADLLTGLLSFDLLEPENTPWLFHRARLP